MKIIISIFILVSFFLGRLQAQEAEVTCEKIFTFTIFYLDPPIKINLDLTTAQKYDCKDQINNNFKKDHSFTGRFIGYFAELSNFFRYQTIKESLQDSNERIPIQKNIVEAYKICNKVFKEDKQDSNTINVEAREAKYCHRTMRNIREHARDLFIEGAKWNTLLPTIGGLQI